VVGTVFQAETGERLGDTGIALLDRNAGQRHRQGNVFGGGQPRHQVKTLEDEADALAAHARLLVG